jgi:thermostable 8-oxoguanine DNA glycosylase
MKPNEYLRYYFLEDYLFKDVHAGFAANKTLTSEEFLAIIIWKANRQKTNVVAGVLASEKSIGALMKQVAEPADVEKVKLLIEIGGIGIPVASAILTVCYPETFTVIDYRSCASLAKILALEQKALRKQFGGDPVASPKAYLEYTKCCKAQADKNGLELREYDRILWGMDLYEGKDGLKELAAPLK